MTVTAASTAGLLDGYDAPDCLIYGIGNVARQDDGLGWAFIDWLEATGACSRATLMRGYQLQLEDADLLRLWAWEQLTPAEIAVVLDTTPNAVSIRLHRAKAALREALRKAEGPAGHEGSEGRTP